MTTPWLTSYDVAGRLLDVSRDSAGPSGSAGDPDGDFLGWYIDRGVVRGLDVSGRCLCASVRVSGDLMSSNWKSRILVDDRCGEGQQAALLSVFTGQLGGPIADLAVLIGEVVAVQRVPITFYLVGGKGYLTIGEVAEARVTPQRSFRYTG